MENCGKCHFIKEEPAKLWGLIVDPIKYQFHMFLGVFTQLPFWFYLIYLAQSLFIGCCVINQYNKCFGRKYVITLTYACIDVRISCVTLHRYGRTSAIQRKIQFTICCGQSIETNLSFNKNDNPNTTVEKRNRVSIHRLLSNFV